MKPQFEVNDTVKIVNYGHVIKHEEISYDICKEVIGQSGKIKEITEQNGKPVYSLKNIKGKKLWYNEDQLEKI